MIFILIVIIFILLYLYKITTNKKNKMKKKELYPDEIKHKNSNKNSNNNSNKKIKGGETFNCTLDEVQKYNTPNNKLIYLNGVIYDITFIINNKLALPTIFKNVKKNNIDTLIYILKNTNIQDLHILFESLDSYNLYISNYNKEHENSNLKEFEFGVLNEEINKEDQINDKFNNFKLIFLVSINQFKKGTICPGGIMI